jgi:hypothetical protein
MDKTGAITMDQLAVAGVIPLDHSTESDALFAGALASREANQGPIDLAFLAAAKDRHIFDDAPAVTAVSFKPFDPQSRRMILKATFVAIPFVVTGKFVVSAFAMMLLRFMRDFAKLALATDHVRSSRKPETLSIGGLITVSVVLGVATVAEALLLLFVGWSRFGLSTNDKALDALEIPDSAARPQRWSSGSGLAPERSGRFGKMNPTNKQTQTLQTAPAKG